jgi:hypothetical protein
MTAAISWSVALALAFGVEVMIRIVISGSTTMRASGKAQKVAR